MALNKPTEKKAPVATAPKAQVGTPTKKGVTSTAKKSALKEAGRGRFMEMTPEQQQKLGTRSKDVAFVHLLGNSYSQVPRGEQKGSESCGLILKNVSDHEIKYLEFPQKSSKVMDADFKNPTVAVAKPGEEFQVTWAEAGALVSRDEFNGYFKGDEKKVIRYTPIAPKKGGLPTTKFILVGQGAMPDFVKDIATKDEMKERKVSPEFERKFHVFAEKRSVNHGTGKRSKKSVNLAAVAVQGAFSEILGDQANLLD